MKKFYSLFLSLFLTVFCFAQYTVDFENMGETKAAYGSGSVTLSGLQWNMTDALIGTEANDWKIGARSARMRGYATSSFTMIEDKTDGLGTLSFSYQRYGTDAQVAWKVQYSTDAGQSWIQIGDSFTAASESIVQTFSEDVNVEGSVRVRILADIASGTSNRRLNIDNITLSNFPSSGPSPLITLSTNSIEGLNYVLENGPSVAQSFQVSVADLDPSTGMLLIEASENFEVSSDNEFFSDFINVAYTDNVLSTSNVYVRLKSNLESNIFTGTVTVSGGTASNKIVNVEGNVVAPFSLPYENDFRTQINYDAALATGFTFDGGVVFGGTAGGGYTRMPNLSSITSPSINFTGQEFIQVSFALTTFGGNTGQKLALKYSSNDGVDYETIQTFVVPSSYRTFNQIIHLNGFEGTGKIKFEMVDGTNQIRFRDLNISVLEDITPSINPLTCGSTINSAIYDFITLDQGYDGDMYEFTIAVEGEVAVVEKLLPIVRFGDFGVANFNYGTTYDLSVRVKYGEEYSNVSGACAVTLTANPTTNVENLCGQTIESIHTKVFALAVSKATSYRFSITNLTTNEEQFYTSTNRFFTFAAIEDFDFATVYAVKVQVKIGNADYGDFGTSCNITTPSSLVSKLRDVFCGSTLTSLYQNIFADVVVGAEGYKFRITANGNSQEIERPDTRFSLAFAEGIVFNQTYDVEVAVLYDGQYGAYSDVCTVTTPASLPTTSLRSQFCGATLSSLGSNFYAKVIFGATAYKFKAMINGNEVEVERNDSRCFMSAFSGAAMNQSYSIQVAAFINGVWSDYGDACIVNIGTVASSKLFENSSSVEMSVSPNPTADVFQLSFNQTIANGKITLFDLSGKQIQSIDFNGMQTITFGTELKTGVYIAKIEANQTMKTFKLVKN